MFSLFLRALIKLLDFFYGLSMPPKSVKNLASTQLKAAGTEKVQVN